MIDMLEQRASIAAAYNTIRKDVKDLGDPVELSQDSVDLAGRAPKPIRGYAVGRAERTNAVILRSMDLLQQRAPQIAQDIVDGMRIIKVEPPAFPGGAVGLSLTKLGKE